MLTPLGKVLRSLRMDRGWLLKDMADGAGVSSAFLSAVETGRKQSPADLIERIIEWGNLSEEEIKSIDSAYAKTARDFRINVPANMSSGDREAAALLARTFGNLPSDEIAAIREIIERRKS